MLVLLFLATLFLAYSNGANDNFKGVATLFGSRTTNYQTAIRWATATTLAGSILSAYLATSLVKSFSGRGLVPDVIANAPDFHLAVALAAGVTIILATLTGFPISTTHSLTGALVGAGLVAIGTQVNFAALQTSFVLPLLLSPLVAIPLGALLYGVAHYLRGVLGIEKEWCLCAGQARQVVSIPQPGATQSLVVGMPPDITLDTLENCTQQYAGKFLGVRSHQLVDTCHFLSVGIVSFARGLNDTPKIVSLILIIQAFSIQGGIIAVAVAMAIGGLLNAHKVAETMSQKITQMKAGQGFSANVVTGLLVIVASTFGLPVSTTHVSVGSIFGVGLISQTANMNVFYQILLSWILTLPIAAMLSAAFYWGLHHP